MVTVRMMEMTVHQVVHVVTVWHGFMATPWPVDVIGVVSRANVVRGARIRIGFIDVEGVLVIMLPVWVVQVTVMKVIHVVVV